MTAILTLLIWIVIAAIVVYVVLWGLGQAGVKLPPVVVQLVWIVFVLLVLIQLVRTLGIA